MGCFLIYFNSISRNNFVSCQQQMLERLPSYCDITVDSEYNTLEYNCIYMLSLGVPRG